MLPRMTAVLIFDLDGTLVDSSADLAEAGNAARAVLGLPPLDPTAIISHVGDGAALLVERLTPGCDALARSRAMAAFTSAYAANCTRRTRPYEGIVAALETLRARGWRLAVATNKPDGFSRSILAGTGLAPLIDTLRGGDGPRKPDPGQLLSIMDELAADVARSWMVGDHRPDLLAAAAAGVRGCFCAWGMGRRDDLPCSAVAQRPADLPAILGMP
jgi:phosphoglycolate phosphatase